MGREAFRKIFHPGYDGCWKGCTVACAHTIKDFKLKTGPYAGQSVWVDGPEYETIAGCGSNWGVFDPLFVAEVNFYCDTYGLDTISVGTSFAFVMECYERGLITQEHTEGLDLKFGNREAALELLHRLARAKGFGAYVGQGIRRMKKIFAQKFGADADLMADIGMESKGLEFSEYMTKESLAQQGGYGLALKGPQHDEAWLIFLDAVHNLMPTFEQKAENLYWFPMWRTWFSLNGLCKLPWNDIVPVDNHKTENPALVIKHINWYRDYFSAVSGQETSLDEMIKMSERVYNFQRIFNLRQGFGRREQDSIPYRAVGPVTEEEYESRRERYEDQLKELGLMDPEGKKTTQEKMAALRTYREGQYEKLKDAAYEKTGLDQRRGAHPGQGQGTGHRSARGGGADRKVPVDLVGCINKERSLGLCPMNSDRGRLFVDPLYPYPLPRGRGFFYIRTPGPGFPPPWSIGLRGKGRSKKTGAGKISGADCVSAYLIVPWAQSVSSPLPSPPSSTAGSPLVLTILTRAGYHCPVTNPVIAVLD